MVKITQFITLGIFIHVFVGAAAAQGGIDGFRDHKFGDRVDSVSDERKWDIIDEVNKYSLGGFIYKYGIKLDVLRIYKGNESFDIMGFPFRQDLYFSKGLLSTIRVHSQNEVSDEVCRDFKGKMFEALTQRYGSFHKGPRMQHNWWFNKDVKVDEIVWKDDQNNNVYFPNPNLGVASNGICYINLYYVGPERLRRPK